LRVPRVFVGEIWTTCSNGGVVITGENGKWKFGGQTKQTLLERLLAVYKRQPSTTAIQLKPKYKDIKSSLRVHCEMEEACDSNGGGLGSCIRQF